jgi:hypothetical protein
MDNGLCCRAHGKVSDRRGLCHERTHQEKDPQNLSVSLHAYVDTPSLTAIASMGQIQAEGSQHHRAAHHLALAPFGLNPALVCLSVKLAIKFHARWNSFLGSSSQ